MDHKNLKNKEKVKLCQIFLIVQPFNVDKVLKKIVHLSPLDTLVLTYEKYVIILTLF